jgi:microcystin-dependent protein
MLGHVVYSSYYKGLTYVDGTKKKYAYMNGQLLDRVDYPELSPFFPTGTYGSSLTKIALPDMTDLYFRGADLGRGADVDRASRTALSGTDPTGDNIGAFQLAAMPLHTHALGTVPAGAPATGAGGNIAITQRRVLSTVNTNATFISVSGTINPSGIVASGSATTSWDVASVTYFPYLGID